MDGLRSFSVWHGFVAVIGGTVLLAACSADLPAVSQRPTVVPTVASPPPSSTVPTSSSAPPPATSGSPAAATVSPVSDGTYRLTADPTCGEFAINGASLVVQGGAATINQGTWPGDDPGTVRGRPALGRITTRGTSFQVHVANGTAAIIDLTGTVGAAGALNGSGRSGGLHLSGETGWTCEFTFTAERGTGAGSAGPTSNVETFYSPTKNISCQILPDTVYCQTMTPQRSVKMSTSGAFATCTGTNCIGDPGEHTPVLDYGVTTEVGLFKCASATGGVTCTAGGTGFKISHSGVVKAP